MLSGEQTKPRLITGLVRGVRLGTVHHDAWASLGLVLCNSGLTHVARHGLQQQLFNQWLVIAWWYWLSIARQLFSARWLGSVYQGTYALASGQYAHGFNKIFPGPVVSG